MSFAISGAKFGVLIVFWLVKEIYMGQSFSGTISTAFVKPFDREIWCNYRPVWVKTHEMLAAEMHTFRNGVPLDFCLLFLSRLTPVGHMYEKYQSWRCRERV